MKVLFEVMLLVIVVLMAVGVYQLLIQQLDKPKGERNDESEQGK